VVQPVLLLADPHDTLIPVSTTHRLAAALPDARVQLVNQIGHHLPRRGAPQIAAAIVAFWQRWTPGQPLPDRSSRLVPASWHRALRGRSAHCSEWAEGDSTAASQLFGGLFLPLLLGCPMIASGPGNTRLV
jgi:hypothetical protein